VAAVVSRGRVAIATIAIVIVISMMRESVSAVRERVCVCC
jgi:hypothetical protein